MPSPPGLSDDLTELAEGVRLTGVVESVVDGLLVRGTTSASVRLGCVRCLTTFPDRIQADVVELFSRHEQVTEPVDTGYEIQEGMIDLDTLLRDALALALPTRPLCRPDCRGLCAQCGAELNAGDCGCSDDDDDPRWSALALLRLPNAR